MAAKKTRNKKPVGSKATTRKPAAKTKRAGASPAATKAKARSKVGAKRTAKTIQKGAGKKPSTKTVAAAKKAATSKKSAAAKKAATSKKSAAAKKAGAPKKGATTRRASPARPAAAPVKRGTAPAKKPSAGARGENGARSLVRRDATGHLDPAYAADLRAKSRGTREVSQDSRAFLRGAWSEDDLAEELGEQTVEAMTTGEAEGEDVLDQLVPEEEGGPFIITTGKQEFAHDVDESNPEDALREPFPTT